MWTKRESMICVAPHIMLPVQGFVVTVRFWAARRRRAARVSRLAMPVSRMLYCRWTVLMQSWVMAPNLPVVYFSSSSPALTSSSWSAFTFGPEWPNFSVQSARS